MARVPVGKFGSRSPKGRPKAARRAWTKTGENDSYYPTGTRADALLQASTRALLCFAVSFIASCVEDTVANDGGTTVEAADAGNDAGIDAGAGADAGDAGTSDGTIRLQLGQSAAGAVTSTDFVTYRLALQANDEVRLSAFTQRGDLQPAAFVSLDDAFIEPAQFTVGNKEVALDYVIQEAGDYIIVVRPHMDLGEGSYILRTECTGGTCAAMPIAPPDVSLRLLAINDFHGHVEPPSNGRGGAAWLASHIQALRAPTNHSILVSAGDLVGASPFLSARFHDEPTIEVMNLIGLDVAGVGNHEFDEGPEELIRLAEGGCHPVDGCEDGTPFLGANFDMLAANVQTAPGTTLFPSTVVRVFGGLAVGIIGMTLEGTRDVTVPSQVEGLVFLDEVTTVNQAIPKLQAMGAETIIVVVHEGGTQDGNANECDNFRGSIATIATMVDDAVDVIVSGHTHRTYNCVIDGKIVTSAGSQGRWISSIDMVLDGATREPTMNVAVNHAVDHSLAPDPDVASLIAAYRTLVDVEEQTVIGTLGGALDSSTDNAGQSALGFVIADSHLLATEAEGAQIAFMNRGGIRASLPAGDITFGQAFAVQPFGNDLVTVTLSGQQLKDTLDDQFAFGGFSVLQPSASLRYRLEPAAGGNGVQIVQDSITVLGMPLDLGASYRVSANAFIAEGGDGHAAFALGTDRVRGGVDIDAFVDYLAASPSPLAVPSLDRITFE